MIASKLIRTAAAALVLPAAATFALAGGDKQHEGQSSASSGSQAHSAQIASDRSRDTGQSSAGQQQQQDAPEGFVLIEERVVYLLGNQPQQHFLAAAQKLAANDKQGAGAELRIAANYIDMQASRAGQEKQHLTKASQKLNKLAEKAQAGEISSPDELNKAFAKANLALARHYQAKAESALEGKNYVMAGYDLDNAANSFRQAMVWSDQQPKQEQVQAMDTAGQVALSLQSERMSVAREAKSDEAKSDQRGGSDQPKADQKRSDDRFGDQAQQASAASSDPRIGTTPAEAQNIAQHAREATKSLGKQIEQFAQAAPSGSEGAADTASEKRSRQQD